MTNTMQVVVEGNTCDLANVRKKARIVIDGKPGKTRKGVLSIFADNITIRGGQKNRKLDFQLAPYFFPFS